MAHAQGTSQRRVFDYGCEMGFLVRSTDANEIVGATLTHMKSAHRMKGDEKQIRAGIKPANG